MPLELVLPLPGKIRIGAIDPLKEFCCKIQAFHVNKPCEKTVGFSGSLIGGEGPEFNNRELQHGLPVYVRRD